MKSLIKISNITLLMFLANSVFAETGKPEFSVKNLGEKTFLLQTKDMTSSYLEVEFQDKKGTTLFSEFVVHTVSFERKYNLNELPKGDYFLFLKSENKTQMLPITILEDGLEFDLENLETVQ